MMMKQNDRTTADICKGFATFSFAIATENVSYRQTLGKINNERNSLFRKNAVLHSTAVVSISLSAVYPQIIFPISSTALWN